MEEGVRPRTAAGAIVLIVVLSLLGCGVADGDDPATTTAARTRPPGSLCERVPLDVVEAAIQLDLDAGTPSEADGHPECHWRERGAGVVVTVGFEPDAGTVEDFEDGELSVDELDLPDLGNPVLWSPTSGRLAVFTGEGRYQADVLNHELEAAEARDAAVTVLRTVIETTEVPDTTTTTVGTPASDPTGLCRKVSIETVEEAVGRAVEPGIFSQPSGGGAPTCVFRALTEGPAVKIRLEEHGTMDFLDSADHQEIHDLGVPARLTMGSGDIYLDTTDGLVNIRLELRPETGAGVRAGLLALAEDYLDPG
jgi:hypothetical protein